MRGSQSSECSLGGPPPEIPPLASLAHSRPTGPAPSWVEGLTWSVSTSRLDHVVEYEQFQIFIPFFNQENQLGLKWNKLQIKVLGKGFHLSYWAFS